jgi:gamma-butyrobetaine dioxygenase
MPLVVDALGAFPAVWLRDNCPCPECRDPRNGQKLVHVLDYADDLDVAAVDEYADSVVVTFAPDGHRSSFARAWLEAQRAAPAGDDRTEAAKILWRAADIADRMPVVEWSRYLGDDGERARALRAVVQVGFALLRDTPLRERTVLDVVRTFGYVRVTNYGDCFDVRTEPHPINLAFTGEAISPHTDNPYRDPVPTLQLLHCLSNAVEGGDSGLVDGFAAAARLRAEDAAAFETLTTTPVPFAWSDAGNVLRSERPLIGVDPAGRIREIRFNNRSMEALRLPRDRLARFYDAYKAFAVIIARTEMQITFRLERGDCVIFDNVRILHSRTAFAEGGLGPRHLQGCYADVDGLASTLAVLERSPSR